LPTSLTPETAPRGENPEEKMGRFEAKRLDDHDVILADLRTRVKALEATAACPCPETPEPDKHTRPGQRGTANRRADLRRDAELRATVALRQKEAQEEFARSVTRARPLAEPPVPSEED
jgi:hypothetical protein